MQFNTSEPAAVGGKARRLIELKDRGFAVPSFFVVPPGELNLDDLRSSLKALPARAFAVRSSANLEDGQLTSFAGQFRSILNQLNFEEVAEAIETVRASADTPAVREYRRHSNDQAPLEMSVIVQEMADAEISGVLFTADPGSGDHQVSRISFAQGLGTAVVEGEKNCVEVRIDLRRWTLEFEGEETNTLLSKEEILEIVRTGLKIAEHYQYPQDIEWCWSRAKRLQIVQTRPITSESIRRRSSSDTLVYDNSNIQESFCGVTLPLTFSFASYAYFQVYRQLMKVAGFSDRQVGEHDDRHRNMLSYVDGHVFYNIRSWYDGLKLLPSFHRHKEDMERMMGVEHPVEFVQTETLTLSEKLKVVPKLARAVAFLALSFIRIDKLHADFTSGFERKLREFDKENLYRLGALETLMKIKDTKMRFLSQWSAPIINDFFVMVYNGKVRRALKKVDMESELSGLLAGEDLASTAPTKELMKIARKIQRQPGIAQWLEQQSGGPATLLQLAAMTPEIAAEIDTYIAKYGDRVVGELKLESIALWQNPEFLFSVLKSMVNAGTDFNHLLAKEQQMRTSAEAKVFASLRSRSFRRNLGKLRKGVRLREDMRLRRTQAFGLFRRLYCHLGDVLARQGAIKNQRDIFFLTEGEIESFLETRSAHRNLKPLIEIRKAEFAQFAGAEPPGHFSAQVPFYCQDGVQTPIVPTTSQATWRGIGCYPGLIRAQVIVLREPEHGLSLAGKVLCTMRTDPGWAPLFPNLAGLLVERGSTLSHSAVIARELGITTVVGARGVTNELSTGDWIELNGTTGEVRLISPPKSENRYEDPAFAH